MEAIGLLAGGVAHDFNNMLSVILSYSSILASDLEPGSTMIEDLGEITAAARRAAELTRNLLAFSRQQVLSPRIVNLNETLAAQGRMLKRLIGADVSLSANYAANLARVEVDPGQVEQVIMNLVVNAREAMPAGGSLAIETSNVEVDGARAASVVGLKPGPHVLITVRDTGHGMSAETMRRIFEPFFTMKPLGKGTGLGLSSSLGIVQQSGGAMAVESALGHGTTFYVYLPVAASAETSEPALPSGVTQLNGKETILVVEDEDNVRNMVRTILRRYGYEVLAAQNGGEALLLCEQHPGEIHAMLSDVVLPLISGTQLCGRLRPLRPDMRVVFMSGYAKEGTLDDLNVGQAFIQKPFTPQSLVTGLRAVLDRQAA
jgi:CheY-like chemotaxis protein